MYGCFLQASYEGGNTLLQNLDLFNFVGNYLYSAAEFSM